MGLAYCSLSYPCMPDYAAIIKGPAGIKGQFVTKNFQHKYVYLPVI